ncbi:hypothetical protein M5K25_026807 [Dendrobium thyrsiflorum]|uniref:F-box domain-containing protein n=1 Tax=Dendrobium thyrsiflorum TaxID=117978 RepID=A0ABD0TY97_DENTH
MSPNFSSPPLIPGLPEELAVHCLLRLPFPYHSLARSVSSPWNRALSSSAFLSSKSLLAHLFVFAFDPSNLGSQWQSLDPRSLRWFHLPPMPSPPDSGSTPACPPAFAFAAIPRSGELFVLGGLRSDTHAPLRSVMIYRAGTNSWSVAEPMIKPRAFFSAGAIDGRGILAVGGDGGTDSVERWEPGGRWRPAAGMGLEGIGRYDSAVMGSRMYVTEGWRWPFSFTPRAAVYDGKRDEWEEMREGMREGWTGSSAVAMGRLFVVSEFGDARVKVYDEEKDDWDAVDGGGVPSEIRRPFTVGGSEEGTIYVVGKGLDVAVGEIVALRKEEGNGWKVEWKVVKGPPAFRMLSPCCSLILYA